MIGPERWKKDPEGWPPLHPHYDPEGKKGREQTKNVIKLRRGLERLVQAVRGQRQK